MNNKSYIYQYVKLDTSFLKIHHRILLSIILALGVSPFSYAQDRRSSVFFVNRGKKQEWLSFPSEQDVLYQIISNAAFKQLENRKAMYAFFQKFLNMPENNEDIETEPFPAASLWSTNTGQVGSPKKGETVSSLNKTYFQRKQIPDNQIRQQIAHLAGIRFDRNLTSSVFTGKVLSDEIVVEKYFLENQLEDYVLPVYVGRMEGIDFYKILVWLKPEGNACAAFLHYTAFKQPFEKSLLITDLPSEKELVDEAIYVPELAFYVVPGSLPYYQPSDLLQFHQKETYKIISERLKELPEIVNTEIISFLQSEM